jgi:hypothetical protein
MRSSPPCLQPSGRAAPRRPRCAACTAPCSAWGRRRRPVGRPPSRPLQRRAPPPSPGASVLTPEGHRARAATAATAADLQARLRGAAGARDVRATGHPRPRQQAATTRTSGTTTPWGGGQRQSSTACTASSSARHPQTSATTSCSSTCCGASCTSAGPPRAAAERRALASRAHLGGAAVGSHWLKWWEGQSAPHSGPVLVPSSPRTHPRRMGFPFPPHVGPTKAHPTTGRYHYLRLDSWDRNVVPYHPLVSRRDSWQMCNLALPLPTTLQPAHLTSPTCRSVLNAAPAAVGRAHERAAHQPRELELLPPQVHAQGGA